MAEPFEEKRGVFHFGAAGRVIASRQRSKIPRSGAAKPLRVRPATRGLLRRCAPRNDKPEVAHWLKYTQLRQHFRAEAVGYTLVSVRLHS